MLVVGAGDDTRAVLVDLGLSAIRGALGAARGALAYMAPEALTGAIDPRGDLYGLGATLHHAVSGAAPFAGDDPARVVRAMTHSPPPPLAAGAAPALTGLIGRLLAKAPADRPASALAVFDELTDAAAALARAQVPRPRPAVQPPLVAPPVRGADELLVALAGELDGCRRGRDGGAVVVTGPAGADVAAVVALAIQRHQLDAAGQGEPGPVRVVDGSLDEIAATLGVVAPALVDDGGRARVAASLRAAAAQAHAATIVDLTGDERAAFALAALAGVGGPGRVIVLAEGELPPVPGGVTICAGRQ